MLAGWAGNQKKSLHPRDSYPRVSRDCWSTLFKSVQTISERVLRATGISCSKNPSILARYVGTLFLTGVWAFILVATMQGAEGRVFGNPEIWQWAPNRTYHVENYKLSLHFDQPKEEVFGDEVVTLRPFEAGFRKFYLDSAELTIEAVTLERAQANALALAFASEGSRLWITLDHDYDPTTPLKVRIVYHGFPRTGLFFVNPTESYPDRPGEVFSQGEPELNHYWFPCWDYPNDMATSETVTTVPEGQVVVSNGKVVKVSHSAGQVTYDWVESIPHSSYLISIAIGPWHKFSDKYEDKPVDYYVPVTVDEATARRSFHLTPDMIRFFSRATGIDYPYEQYAQTTVHNYIFGGQENVSATTLTDATLHDERADQDYPSTNLVSHELGQHWFGDFVQGHDWANIWLNEGFATYMEALYTQHHEGDDAYRFAVYNDQLTAQQEDREAYRRPLVDRHYADPLDMFDATTHEKGAAVLEMLRYVVDGADALSKPASQREPLFRALHRYLTVHRAQTADTADLIAAIRSTTGQELGWFFREWVFMAGYPEYRVEAKYDAAKKVEHVTIAQTQRVDAETPIFEMPIEVAFYGANGERRQVQVRDNSRRQEFEIALDFEPLWIDFDPNDFIYKTVEFHEPLESLTAQAEKDPSMMSRLWAVRQLGAAKPGETDKRVETLAQVLTTDPFYAVRAAAATGLGNLATERSKAVLVTALPQTDSRVRAAVVEALGHFSKDQEIFNALVRALQLDPSYAVEATAAKQLGRSGVAAAFEILRVKAQKSPEIHVVQATLTGLASTKNPQAMEVLLAQAQPGVPERIRMYALAGLVSFPDSAIKSHLEMLADVVRAALHDSFYPVEEAGEELVGVFHLTQFEPDIQNEADNAPMAMERESARKALEQLRPSK
jgi:aminopeptidase N